MKKYYIEQVDKIKGYISYFGICDNVEDGIKAIKRLIKIDKEDNITNPIIVYNIYEFETDYKHECLTSEDRKNSKRVLCVYPKRR